VAPQRWLELVFDNGWMVGGMGKARGVPLRDRPTMVGDLPVDRPPRRHCWVTGPAEAPGPHPGLVITWERRDDDWWAYVIWTVVTDRTVVQQWLPAELIRPA
jgi:hypothetical protein